MDESSEELLKRTLQFIEDHKRLYLSSGGSEGHVMDLTHAGARGMLPTLLLKTVGRKSGKTLIAPLIYGVYGGEWVVIASKGGAPEHPAWFLNLKAREETEFQVATQAYRASWREVEGEERERVWAYMQELYPPYADYQVWAGDRVIPVVMLKIIESVPVFGAE